MNISMGTMRISFPLSSLGRVQASWSRRPPASGEKKERADQAFRSWTPSPHLQVPKMEGPEGPVSISDAVSPGITWIRGGKLVSIKPSTMVSEAHISHHLICAEAIYNGYCHVSHFIEKHTIISVTPTSSKVEVSHPWG